jgi:hypothetical protein
LFELASTMRSLLEEIMLEFAGGRQRITYCSLPPRSGWHIVCDPG